MSEYLIQDTTLDAIADAINAKTGGSSAMTPAEMVTAIGSISGGGDDSVLDDLIEGKSGIHLVSNATSVADETFAGPPKMPGDEATGIGAFLESVSLPNATSIGARAFIGCSALTSIDLPSATSIGERAFRRCSALTSVDLPNVTSIGENAFGECSALTSIDLPNATNIGAYAFDGISSTAVINLGAAEGEISGAPWDAPDGVTINYNVKG